MNAREIMEYYKREDVQSFFLKFSKGREIAGVYRNGSFGKRPNTLSYPQDIISQVRGGVVEFHSSVEHWTNPMALREGNYSELRSGFDVIMDIDCKEFEHGKIAAIVISDELEKHDVKGFSIKFSGNKGFHLGIPWASLPKEVDYKKVKDEFPMFPKNIGLYLKSRIEDKLRFSLLEKESLEQLAEATGIPRDKLLVKGKLNPFLVVDIDPVLLSPRHLFRMPYSINKKTSLVSIPLSHRDLRDFKKEDASIDKVRVTGYLDKGRKGEAELLVAEAMDWIAKKGVKERKEIKKRFVLEKKVPEEFFPPCVKNIQKGLADGKKRSVFTLINFLHSAKWDWEEIEEFLLKWNEKNSPPLREGYITNQVRYYRKRGRFPPPNCSQEGWYRDFRVCMPDHICRDFIKNKKNPVNYPFKIMGRETVKKRKTRRKK
jgi:hypothetical protein